MKYLQDYREQAQTDLFEKLGTFFAFSQSQFDEGRKEGVKYVSLGSGCVTPEGTEKELMDTLDKIHADALKQDLEENGIDAIIKRELGNYECYYTGDITDAFEELKQYGTDWNQVMAIYRVERLTAEV